MAIYTPIPEPATIVFTDNTYEVYVEFDINRTTATKNCTTMCCTPIVLQILYIVLCTFVSVFNIIYTITIISGGKTSFKSIQLIVSYTLVCAPMIALLLCLLRIRLLMN